MFRKIATVVIITAAILLGLAATAQARPPKCDLGIAAVSAAKVCNPDAEVVGNGAGVEHREPYFAPKHFVDYDPSKPLGERITTRENPAWPDSVGGLRERGE